MCRETVQEIGGGEWKGLPADSSNIDGVRSCLVIDRVTARVPGHDYVTSLPAPSLLTNDNN